MMSQAKRHYRVAERTKEVENENCSLSKADMTQLSILGLCIYTFSIILSFSVGYLLGKNE